MRIGEIRGKARVVGKIAFFRDELLYLLLLRRKLLLASVLSVCRLLARLARSTWNRLACGTIRRGGCSLCERSVRKRGIWCRRLSERGLLRLFQPLPSKLVL